jgi:hypothetical protein
VDSAAPVHHDFLATAWTEIITPAEFVVVPEFTQKAASATEGESPPDTPPRLYLRHLALLI